MMTAALARSLLGGSEGRTRRRLPTRPRRSAEQLGVGGGLVTSSVAEPLLQERFCCCYCCCCCLNCCSNCCCCYRPRRRWHCYRPHRCCDVCRRRPTHSQPVRALLLRLQGPFPPCANASPICPPSLQARRLQALKRFRARSLGTTARPFPGTEASVCPCCTRKAPTFAQFRASRWTSDWPWWRLCSGSSSTSCGADFVSLAHSA
mmetsp:Transcript_21993/g.48029  ORF Transcript_21993/g.48029 Transcript_21993/m.48029 type:complete len:205 (-) Transcript_21993:902-1516(-)